MKLLVTRNSELGTPRARAARAGFTIAELLVVIAISAMFSAIAIVYSRTGQNQVALSVEASKIADLILQAKTLSLATYNGATTACGYGISVNIPAQTYSLFVYRPSGAPPCPAESSITTIAAGDQVAYAPQTWQVHVANGLKILNTAPGNDILFDVLFYPPNPDVLISRDGASFMNPAQASQIYLQTIDGSATKSVSVSPAGQVSLN